jgi:hypothetical protein
LERGYFFRLIGIGGSIGVVGLTFLYFYATSEYEKWAATRDNSKITANVWVDIEKCSKEYPFFVTVVNGSDKLLLSYELRIEVRKKGRSTNLAKSYDTIKDDKILKPGEGWGHCRRIEKSTSSYPTEWITDLDVDAIVTRIETNFE